MSLLTLDFETYYADDFSLSRMTTEEYINDPRFETIGVSVSIDGGKPSWFSGTHEQIKAHLDTYDWKESALVAQNASFDAAILAWRFGIIPAFIYDTMSMAKALSSPMQSVGLEALASRFKVGVKGTEVVNAKNKRRADFRAEELADYGRYCDNDVVLTYKLWEIFAAQLVESEHELIDMTIRMFIEPTFIVDVDMLEGRLAEIRQEKSEMLSQLMGALHCATEEEVRKQLASNPKFAKLLESLGVPTPMKTSKTTGKETFALAKNDPEFMALLEHENPLVQQLCSVRVGTKSTIEESRIVRFIGIAERNMGKIPIPLRYYGAHTGRWAGEEKINMQNLPSRDARKKALKNAIKAPPGYYVVNSDSSQIEARVLAYLAGQDDLVKVFAAGGDPYCLFATKVYNKTITKEFPIERFVGKTCILGLGFGTGWKKLQNTLKTTPPYALLSDDECQNAVNIYRTENDKIPDLWNDADRALQDMISWPDDKAPWYLGKHKLILVTPEGLQLPNGLYIRYTNLRRSDGGIVHDTRKGETGIWGGGVVENVVQALARLIVSGQMLDIRAQGYKIALTVHDSAVPVVPRTTVDEDVKKIKAIMSTAPSWTPGLPVACDAKYAPSYGEC